MLCLECKTAFEKNRPHQQFCKKACRYAYHNREKLGGIRLTRQIYEQLQEFADINNVSLNRMACIMLHQRMNPEGMPLPDDTVFDGPGNHIANGNSSKSEQGG